MATASYIFQLILFYFRAQGQVKECVITSQKLPECADNSQLLTSVIAELEEIKCQDDWSLSRDDWTKGPMLTI